MKNLFALSSLLMLIVMSSCSKFDDSDIWETLNNHENRITAIEELCKQINTNIKSLQVIIDALDNKDYITNVSPVQKDNEIIGYTITFAYSDTITIYNGEDGQDGEAGNVPLIGVMKDTDGVYYWTIDGEWLLDGKGNKIKALGSDGSDGTNGVDGVTPRLKIESGYWYVSYDEGRTWDEIGKAIDDSSDPDDMGCIFTSVTQDEEYVYFNLADGDVISFPKKYNISNPYIEFDDVAVNAICLRYWDYNHDGKLSYEEAALVVDLGEAFKSNIDIYMFNELQYFNSLTSISDNAFYGVFKEYIYTSYYNYYSKLTSISLPTSVTSIGTSSFEECRSLSYINLHDGIINIGDRAFYFAGLTEVDLPETLKSIGDSAFSRSSISSIVIPDSVTTIGEESFYWCTNLSMVTIGANVVSIGSDAFDTQRNSIMDVYCKAVVPPAADSSIFYDYQSLRIYVPIESVDKYKSAPGWSSFSKVIVGYDFKNN